MKLLKSATLVVIGLTSILNVSHASNEVENFGYDLNFHLKEKWKMHKNIIERGDYYFKVICISKETPTIFSALKRLHNEKEALFLSKLLINQTKVNEKKLKVGDCFDLTLENTEAYHWKKTK